MDSIRKSFRSGSNRYSSSWPSSEHEEHPILASTDDNDRGEVILKIDNSNNYNQFTFPNQIQNPRQSQYNSEISEDPPSKLISNFIHKQRANGGEMALDVDLEMDEFKKSKDLRVSFVPDRDSSDSSDPDEAAMSSNQEMEAEILKCTSNSAFSRNSGLLRAKTRSRLMDPPMMTPTLNGAISPPRSNWDDDRKSGFLSKKSGPLKSGFLSKSDEDDEDPFLEEDLPEDYTKTKFGVLTILQFVSLILIITALVCSLTIKSLERKTVWNLHLWKWEVMVLSIICGRLLSDWIIRLIVFFVERNFLLRKRVLYFVYGVKNAVQNCIWLGLALLTWNFMFDKDVLKENRGYVLLLVTKVLICLLVTTLVWLVKTLLLKVLASSFHVSTYFDRIQEAVFNQYVIETLSGPPLIETQQLKEEEDRMFDELQMLQNAGATIPIDLRAATFRSGRIGGTRKSSAQLGVGKSVKFSGAISSREIKRQEDAITIDHLHRLNQKNVSAWNMKRLMKIVRHGTLSTLDERIATEGGEDESMQIKSELEAKAAAKKIFNNVAKPGAKYIYLVDFMRFMREDEARKTMSLFEGADDKFRISRRCLKNWVVNAFRERRALSLTLNDTKTAVNTLHRMANIIVVIIVVSLWLLILNIATTHFFVFIGSQLLVAVFMFGNTLKLIFEAIIFLFVMHPFDVGDRCEIDGIQMFVEEMNILTTIFLRFDNQKITYPNSVLATLPIGNFYRSPDMGESIDFCVHVSTPLEKIAIMKERIVGFMENKKDHWYPGAAVVLRDVDDMNRLKVSIWMRHRMNFQDMGPRWDRRELVVREMIRVLKELDIEYRMLPVDVNVRDMPALPSSRLPSNWTACSRNDF